VILAAGLTPAWQQILCFDRLALGEVNRAREVHWCASGKVLNVGLALHHLRAEGLTLAPLGGLPGEAIRREFAETGIAARWIDCRRTTRVCTTVIQQPSQVGRIDNPPCASRSAVSQRPSGLTTELVENASPLDEDELVAFLAEFQGLARAAQWIILSGSLPAGAPPSIFADLIVAHAERVILDIRGPELQQAIRQRPYLVKLNREELTQTVGRDLKDDTAMRAAARDLLSAGAQAVVVTQGGAAVWLLTPDESWRLTPPEVEVVNPIGSGDSMAGAIAWGLSQDRSLLDAVRLGVAAGAENAATLLPARLDPCRTHDLSECVGVTRVC
jgi:fructose-1-phosphate kinase PfkB-like protein